MATPITSTTTSITATAPSITLSTKYSSKLLPAVIITPVAIIVCGLLIYYHRKIFKSVNFNVRCCLKSEQNIDMDAEYDEPYANDDYEIPYKLESDSNTRL